MNRPGVSALMAELAAFKGIDGCALVDAETGMVWHHCGSLDGIEQIGEAAIEFWRVQTRLSSHFTALGSLQSTAYSFSSRVVALFPCSVKPALILVCVAAKGDIAWNEWGTRVVALRKVLAAAPVVAVAAPA